LSLWALCSALTLSRLDFSGAQSWMRSPLNAVLAVLLIAVTFQHMHAGLRVVVEDYLHKTETKAAVLILNLFVCVLFAALAIFSVLRVALMTGAAL
jgi:succinate dehydrogenase / fumarate reductase membrane anchor subunit